MPALRFGSELLALPRRFDGIDLLAREEPAPLADAARALKTSLESPVAGPPLSGFLAGKQRVGLVLPDATRPLPTLLVEALIEALGPALKLVRVANGTHRPSTPDEHRQLLGRFHGLLPIGDRKADDAAAHARLPGEAGAIDREAAGCDGLVLIGPASFHYLAGFGGGGKLVAPGLADRATAELVHSACLAPGGGRHPRVRAGVLEGNPLRERIDAVCRAAPEQFYVIPLLDSSYRPTAVLAGERDATFRASCDLLSRGWGVPCRRYRTVIAGAGGRPYDVDFVQAHKAWEAAEAACAPGGTIVWVASCPESLPPRHRAFLEEHPTAARMEAALRQRFDIAAHTVWAAREKAERRRVVAVTRMDRSCVEALGMEWAPDLEAALTGRPADDALLLPYGARFLPVAELG